MLHRTVWDAPSASLKKEVINFKLGNSRGRNCYSELYVTGPPSVR